MEKTATQITEDSSVTENPSVLLPIPGDLYDAIKQIKILFAVLNAPNVTPENKTKIEKELEMICTQAEITRAQLEKLSVIKTNGNDITPKLIIEK